MNLSLCICIYKDVLVLLFHVVHSQVFDDASPVLYKALHGLLWSLLCDPTTSPFLLDVATPAAAPPPNLGGGESVADVKREGCDKAVVASPRPLMAGLTCLGAHEDLGQRALLLVSKIEIRHIDTHTGFAIVLRVVVLWV